MIINAPFLYTLYVYVLLVAGGVVPSENDDLWKVIIKAVLLFVFLFLVIRGGLDRKSLRFLLAFVAVGFSVFGLASFGSENINYAIEKFDGAVLSVAIGFFVWRIIQERYGFGVPYQMFVKVAFVILLMTVAYKMAFGFFDRQERFFLNGPIVFGWLMGLAALISLNCASGEKKKIYFFLFLLFFVSVLWTESKGPLIALVFAVMVYFAHTVHRRLFLYLFLLVVSAFFAYALIEMFSVYFEESRFGGVFRWLGQVQTDVDYGSIGLREALLSYSFNLISENFYFGIGLGNFVFLDFVYPHNQYIEVFVEMGVFAFLLHTAFILFAFLKSQSEHRVLISFLFLSGLFSGDISYLRYLYLFVLLSLFYSKKNLLAAR